MTSVLSSQQVFLQNRSLLTMQHSDSNFRLEEAGRTLVHQQSLGNPQLLSIDADWLAEHRDLLDIFIQNPNDPQILDRIPETPQSEPVQSQPIHGHQPAPMSVEFGFQEVVSSSSQPMSLDEHYLNPFSVPRLKEDPFQLEIQPLSSTYPASNLTSDIETPQRQASRSSGLRPPRSSPKITGRSDSAPTPGRSFNSTPKGSHKSLVPEISLAERADTLGAVSLQQSSRRTSAGRAQSLGASRSSEGSGEEVEEAEEAAGGQEVQRKGPGRKKRTSPILIETEDGDYKYVTPAEYRKLRRRITNRLSARRMRQKHAHEKNLVHTTQMSLQGQVEKYRGECKRMEERLAQLELDNGILQADNSRMKTMLTTFQQPSSLQPSPEPQMMYSQYPILQSTPVTIPGMGQASSHRQDFPTVPTDMNPMFSSHLGLPQAFAVPTVSSSMHGQSSFAFSAPSQLQSPTVGLPDMPVIPFGRLHNTTQQAVSLAEHENQLMEVPEPIFTSQHMMQ